MDARPGDLFVLRNLGNIVPPYGTGEHAVGAAIEYAVRRLGVKYIIVCGHTDCGAITALDVRLDLLHESHLSHWIEYARTAQTRVDALGVEPDARHRAIVEENVRCQLENLQTYDAVRRALQQDELTLYGWVYDLSTGRISQLDAESDQFMDEGEIQMAP
jgi:carbonic anhydrase